MEANGRFAIFICDMMAVLRDTPFHGRSVFVLTGD